MNAARQNWSSRYSSPSRRSAHTGLRWTSIFASAIDMSIALVHHAYAVDLLNPVASQLTEHVIERGTGRDPRTYQLGISVQRRCVQHAASNPHDVHPPVSSWTR